MVGFSVQEMAFGGFAAVREHPRALYVWTPLAFAASIGVQIVSFGLPAPGLERPVLNQDPTQAMAMIQRLLPTELALAAVGLIVTAIVQTSMIRLVLRPSEERLGYVRLGSDELRQFGLALLGAAVITGVYFLAAFAFILVGAVLVGMAGAPSWLAIAFGAAATLSVVILVSVRLSLAPALTFDRGRIDLFGSWTLTRGRFWQMLGLYFLVGALCAVVYVFAAVLIFGLGRLVMGSEIDTLMKAPTSAAGLFSPLRLIMAAFWSFLSALVWPVLFTPSARLYVALAPDAHPGPRVWA
jgi:hypothetical protein